MDELAISTRGLTKHYGRVPGILDLALAVRRGEMFGFLGANGAGKTTTIRLLMGLLRPGAGQASVLGLDPWREGVAARARLGYLPGELRLYETMTGHQLLDRLAAPYPAPPARRGELLERLGLPPDALARKVRTFSRGMKQKLGLVQALAHDPELIVLDEPSEGLDPMVRFELKAILREARARGRTVFYSTHNLAEAEQMCDRVGIVRASRLVAVEEVHALAARRIHRVEVEFADSVAAAALSALPGVTIEEAAEHRVRLRATGDLGALLRALAATPLVQLEVRGPTLEDLFLHYYQESP